MNKSDNVTPKDLKVVIDTLEKEYGANGYQFYDKPHGSSDMITNGFNKIVRGFSHNNVKFKCRGWINNKIFIASMIESFHD
jgi:hypothetical protein